MEKFMNLAQICSAEHPKGKAVNLLAQRRLRDKFFADGFYAVNEAGWYMLLDLYVARWNNQKISVTSICGASYSPPTTALRHLDNLMRQALVESAADPSDARRRIIKITEQGWQIMSDYLAAI